MGEVLAVGRGRKSDDTKTRVASLELRLDTIETRMDTVCANTAEILTFVTAANGMAGFAKKHGPRAIAFVTGILATAGVGNPAVWKFIGAFFGN